MTGFACVLIPLDGSERAESALDWVRVLGAQRIRLDDQSDPVAAP